MDYSLLRAVHVCAVVVTLALFLLRGYWMLMDAPRLQARWLRIVPHGNDAILLAAALALLAAGGLTPLEQPWLLAKIGGLLAYIVLGSIALKRGRTKPVRIAALAGALAVFGYIVAVALTKQVMPWMSA
ncbi:MAG: SirB2 family protein [Betaproteobacteria bacterium]|nr:SirB2 family protein [Betaproteobacteria bacterium]